VGRRPAFHALLIPFVKFRTAIVVLFVAAVGCLTGAYFVFRPRITPVEHGRRMAETNGCFGCHGPEGIRGAANPGRDEKTVPTYEGDLMMFASDPGEVREWIHDGSTASRRESESWNEERARGVLRMPAYGHRLSARKIDDLVAFVLAVNGQPAPKDSLALSGRDRAEALGCFGCHGAAGRFARPNPGSLKGYIPPWDGPDFPELVQGRQEFGEWVERGVSGRFEKNPIAQYFLKRAPVKMRPYRGHLEPGDVDALWAYVRWLRGGSGAAAAGGAPP
jgi:mono/diheme cytochrome c family protein